MFSCFMFCTQQRVTEVMMASKEGSSVRVGRVSSVRMITVRWLSKRLPTQPSRCILTFSGWWTASTAASHPSRFFNAFSLRYLFRHFILDHSTSFTYGEGFWTKVLNWLKWTSLLFYLRRKIDVCLSNSKKKRKKFKKKSIEMPAYVKKKLQKTKQGSSQLSPDSDEPWWDYKTGSVSSFSLH